MRKIFCALAAAALMAGCGGEASKAESALQLMKAEDFQTTIDGKKVETYKTFDSLVAFDIAEAGDHDIVLKYRSKAFVYGMTLSVASTAIFALLIIFEKKIYGFIYAKFYKEPLTLPADSDSTKKEKKARGKKDGSNGDN